MTCRGLHEMTFETCVARGSPASAATPPAARAAQSVAWMSGRTPSRGSTGEKAPHPAEGREASVRRMIAFRPAAQLPASGGSAATVGPWTSSSSFWAPAAPCRRRGADRLLLARVGGDRLLFDCGEGSQRQMQRSTGLVPVDDIFVTHYTPTTSSVSPGCSRPTRSRAANARCGSSARPGFELCSRRFSGCWAGFHRGRAGRARRRARRSVRRLPRRVVPGRAPDSRLRLRGDRGRPARAPRPGGGGAARDQTMVPTSGACRRGEGGGRAGPDGTVPAGPGGGGAPKRGRRIVITGDTAPCDATLAAADRAQLLVHDASFADEERERARRHRPLDRAPGRRARSGSGRRAARPSSTSRRATTFAPCSPRRARCCRGAIAPRDFDVVEIPFPERGAPRHLEGGASAAPSPRAPRGPSGPRSPTARPELSRAARRGRRPPSAIPRTPGPPGGSASPAAGARRATPRSAARPPSARGRAQGPSRPTRPWSDTAARPAPPSEPLLLRRQLEAAHDLQERAAAVATTQQRVVRVELPPARPPPDWRSRPGGRSPANTRGADPGGEHRARPRPRNGEQGSIGHGRREPVRVENRVQRRDQEPPGAGCGSPTRRRSGRRCRGRRGGRGPWPSASIASPNQPAKPDHE